MEVLVAVVEPGFKESDWCSQEVGFALGRKIDIIPLRAGLDPFGFFGKYQGIQVKNKRPDAVAKEIAQLLLKKPKHRIKLLQGIGRSFSRLHSEKKIELVELLNEWSVISDEELKLLLERISLSDEEKSSLKVIVKQVGAFMSIEPESEISSKLDDDIPF